MINFWSGFRSEDKKEIIAEYMLKRILHLRSKKRMTKIYDYNFVDKLEIDKILAICPKISSYLIIKSLEDTNLRDFVENITQYLYLVIQSSNILFIWAIQLTGSLKSFLKRNIMHQEQKVYRDLLMILNFILSIKKRTASEF